MKIDIEDDKKEDDTQPSMQIYIPAYPTIEPPFVQCPPIDPQAFQLDSLPIQQLQQLQTIQAISPQITFQEINQSLALRTAEKWGSVVFTISIMLIVLFF